MASVSRISRDGDVAAFASAPLSRVTLDNGAVRLHIGNYEVVLTGSELEALVAGRREVEQVCARAGR